MPAPAFKRVEELFHQAAALPAAERPGFLDEACAGDARLRAAVEDLLRHDTAGEHTDTFLVSPVAAEAEQLRPEQPTVLDVGQGAPAPRGPLPSVPGYEILGERGRGGMGVVYRARQTGLNRTVALKMLLPEAAATPELLARFRREAEALARLRHPNVITVYDVGDSQGRPYFTMEYVAGPNLAELLAGRSQDAAASAGLVEILARAIYAVHQAGIVHRDLKPANVLLEKKTTTDHTDNTDKKEPGTASSVADLIPKITDFGLARDEAGGPRLTKSGVAMGTPCYMAPEQARPRLGAAGPAADVYALGAILYEMLAGRPPFEGETPSETIVQVIEEEPLSPARLRPGLPRDVVTICLKCLEKSPRRRYATALDLAEDLRRFQAGEPIRARPVGPGERCYRWCRRRPVVAGLLALCASLIVAFVVTVVYYDVRLSEALTKEAALAGEEQQDIVQLHIRAGAVALEADDSFTALFSFTEALRLDRKSPDRNHRTRIATTLRQCPRPIKRWHPEEPVVQPPPLPAVSDAGIRFGARSDKGHWLFTVGANGKAELRNTTTGEATASPLKVEPGVKLSAMSGDGRRLALAGTDGVLSLRDVATGKSVGRAIALSQDVSRIVLGPDGRLVLLEGAGEVRVWDFGTGRAVTPPLGRGGGAAPAAFRADGTQVVTVGADGTARLWQLPRGPEVGNAAVSGGGSLAERPVTSLDGRWVAVCEDRFTVRVRDTATGTVRTPPLWHRGAVLYAAFSPDSTRLLTASDDRVARVWDAETGEVLAPPLRHVRAIKGVFFSADGNRACVIHEEGAVSSWDLTPDDRPVEDLVELARATTGP